MTRGRLPLWLPVALCALLTVPAQADSPGMADGAAALTAHYQASAERLRNSPFQRPILVDSTESPGKLKGEIYALVEQPISVVNAALDQPGYWCEVLLLHPNVAQCRVGSAAAGPLLKLHLGARLKPSLKSGYAADFSYRLKHASADYYEAHLDTEGGPAGTSQYRILLEAVPVAGGKSYLHLAYSYSYGYAARLATDLYLSTKGRGKVGFTVTGRGRDGKPQYIAGLRGAVERNAMRYYLAIDAWLGALAAPAKSRFEQSLLRWFAAAERYPRQLDEQGRANYLAVKRSEYQRQQAPE